MWLGAVLRGDLTGLTGDLAACAARTDLDAAVSRSGELALLGPLAQAVDRAAGHQSYVEWAGEAVLAGWDPDQTYWLTDVLAAAGPPTGWEKTGAEPPGWVPGHPGQERG